MKERVEFYEFAGHTGFRGESCPVGQVVDPANVSRREDCPVSEINYRIRQEGIEHFTKDELEEIGFTVVQEVGRPPMASCINCDKRYRLRPVFVQEET